VTTKRAIALLGLVALSACASTPTFVVQDPIDGPSFGGIMDRLAEMNESYRNLSEARGSMVTLFGALGLDVAAVTPSDRLDLGAAAEAIVEVLPCRVGWKPVHGDAHEQRLARALAMLDDELRRDGHGTLGCERAVDEIAAQ